MSPSLLGSFDICPKRAQYDMAPDKPRFTGEARAVGTGFHGGLEGYYRERLESGTFTPDLSVDGPVYKTALKAFGEEELTMETNSTPWETSRGDAWTRVLTMIDAYFNGNHHWPEEYTVVAVEEKVNLPWFDEWSATSIADLILLDPAGWLIVDDHKTAGRMWDRYKHLPRKNVQAVWYGHWFEQHYQRPVLVTFSVMTYAGKFERRVATPRPENIAATMVRAEQIARLLELQIDLPGNPSSTLCSSKYCDWWLLCPHGAATDTIAA